MHVRLSSVTRRGKTYQYAQLVESVRREDGLPVHRVVANLGRVSDPVQLENLKAAFVANRAGQRLAPVTAATAETALETARLRRPIAVLRYLDVAVVRARPKRECTERRSASHCCAMSRGIRSAQSSYAPHSSTLSRRSTATA